VGHRLVGVGLRTSALAARTQRGRGLRYLLASVPPLSSLAQKCVHLNCGQKADPRPCSCLQEPDESIRADADTASLAGDHAHLLGLNRR